MGAGPVRLGLRMNSSHFSGAYDPVVYGRGTWLIHMLREMMKGAEVKPGTKPSDPDALFFSVLKELQASFAGKKMNTRDFLRAFERVLPPSAAFERQRSLDWFYDGWINGNAIPVIELDQGRITTAGGR